MVNFKNLPNTSTPINAENLNKMQTDLQESLVKRTGDSMTGNLVIQNDSNTWKQLATGRTINDTVYYTAIGTGVNNEEPSAVLQLYNQDTESTEARIELRKNKKLYNGKTNRAYAEYESKNVGNQTGEVLIGNILIQFGLSSITPTVANTPTKKTITFKYKYKNAPNVQVTAISTVPRNLCNRNWK